MFYNFDLEQYLSFFSYNNIRINDVVEILIFIGIALYLINHFQHTRMWILIKCILSVFVV